MTMAARYPRHGLGRAVVECQEYNRVDRGQPQDGDDHPEPGQTVGHPRSACVHAMRATAEARAR